MGTADAAARLLDAYESLEPLAPIADDFGGDISLAYAIQQHQLETRLAEGRAVKGHKVGLTSRAMQHQLGVSEPDYGFLLDDMFLLDSQPVPTGYFIAPKVEPEIALVLGSPLSGPGVTAADALRAIDFALASLEIIDSRIADWEISLFDTIADNASSGAVVLGTKPVRLDAIDLAGAGCVLHKNGAVVGSGAGAAVLGSPVNALVWLANTLGRLGVTLEAGSVIMPGSLCGAVEVAPGDTVSATFAGLGTVTTRFAPVSTVSGGTE
ncbi:2-keto-4-pentenoate hydratase [Salinibacterium sp. dk2585]|uniref:2-keto-4-pentenoate hydratase n=1 Tax=unclassified Salinibacterium TaxID=2632331 RepID=UPI0011C24E23|nr:MULTISPECIES: 2-keto-4-pentenoate hydratase [unclassified Salinibacterium]QEE60249.1 2-keto-4-pentenoate hydratase [Salinibacterium sp. dk2585]TXK55321.1 2-keto-4-pentenoate hydratase [Salinibacterium sp. dk5596]